MKYDRYESFKKKYSIYEHLISIFYVIFEKLIELIYYFMIFIKMIYDLNLKNILKFLNT